MRLLLISDSRRHICLRKVEGTISGKMWFHLSWA